MRAIVITTTGGPEVLQLREVENPSIEDDEVLIHLEAAGVNRADTLQRKGMHPPPKGASPYPGLECSGIVEQVGRHVTRWKIGDQVCIFVKICCFTTSAKFLDHRKPFPAFSFSFLLWNFYLLMDNFVCARDFSR